MRTEEVNSLTLDNAAPNQRLNRTTADINPFPKIEPLKEYAIEFENVSRQYRLHHEAKLTLQDRVVNLFKKNNSYEEFWALKDISFKLERGKTLGIIGANGAGKSTLLKLATRIIEPTDGVVRVNGRVSAMLELGTGFHPELSARDNIYLNGAFYGFDRKQMDERYERIVEFSELGKFIDTPVKHFSSGMYMRLGFAVAITVSPDILIIDEVLAVGDAAFGRKCQQAIVELKEQSKAMLFVSHAAGEISRFCDEVIYLANGRIVAQGKPGDVLDEYMIASVGPSYFTSKLMQHAGTPDQAQPENGLSDEKKEPVTSTKSNNISIEEILLGDKQKLFAESVSQPYQVTNGISQLSQLWQISLPQVASSKNQSNTEPRPEYYLSLINPHHQPVTFDLTGYKKSSGLFDQAVGALREVPMGQLEIKSTHSMLLKLEEGALSSTSMLKLTSSQPLAVEFVEYLPSSKITMPPIKPSATPSQDWYFPYVDIRSINNCRLVVFNILEQTAQVHLTLYRDFAGQVPRIRSFECGPQSQLTIDLNEELAGGEGERRDGERFYGGVFLEATSPVIIERHSLQMVSPSYHLMDAVNNYQSKHLAS
jgi:ABC-type polysaccharide/polyol phosphate transport system ATPase subunit